VGAEPSIVANKRPRQTGTHNMYVCVKIEILNFEILHTSEFGFLFVPVHVVFFVWMARWWALESAAASLLASSRLKMV
jgi:hypothetical protein